MDKKILMLGLFLASSVFGMNIDDCNLNYNAQQTTLAEDVQEGDFCSGLTSYNGELGYYLLRLDDEEGLKHVRKLTLDELIYFNGWKYTLPKTEEGFKKFIEDRKVYSKAYSRYMTELVFHCVNGEKELLKAKIENGKHLAFRLAKCFPFNIFDLRRNARTAFEFYISDEYIQFTHEIEMNDYEMSNTLFLEFIDGINSIVANSSPEKTVVYSAHKPYYICCK